MLSTRSQCVLLLLCATHTTTAVGSACCRDLRGSVTSRSGVKKNVFSLAGTVESSMCLPVSWCSSLKVSCWWCKLQCQDMNCAGWGNGLGICGAVPAMGVAASCKGVERTSDYGCVLGQCICISHESELSHTILNLVKQDTPGWHMKSWCQLPLPSPPPSPFLTGFVVQETWLCPPAS